MSVLLVGCISEICFSICLAKIIDSSSSFVLKLEWVLVVYNSRNFLDVNFISIEKIEYISEFIINLYSYYLKIERKIKICRLVKNKYK